MSFASLYVPTSGNHGDLTAVEKKTKNKKQKNGTEVRGEVDRLYVMVFAPSIIADIGKMLLKDTKKAFTAGNMENLLSKGTFVLNINLHCIYSTCL